MNAPTPLHADSPRPGYYKYRRNRDAPWEPAAIFFEKGTANLRCRIGADGPSARMEDPHEKWTFLAGNPMPKDEVLECFRTGKWRSDPPPVPKAASAPMLHKPTGVEAGGLLPPVARKVGPGDNSRDPAAYAQMLKEGIARVTETGELLPANPVFAEAKSKLLADAEAALVHFAANPIKIRADADKCENWRDRIAKTASALDAARKAEKAPFLTIVDEIDDRYFTPIREATAKAKRLGDLGSAWAHAEDTRKLKEAQEAARKQLEIEQAREHAAQEQVALQLGETPPEAPPPVATPMVVVERTLIGTGARRKGARAEKATAIITDLKAAAAYYAEQGNADLIKLIQGLANKAANANAMVPGCRMSWEKPAAEAAE